MQQNLSTAPVQVIVKVLVVALVRHPALSTAETHAREHVVTHATTAAKPQVMDVNVPS